MKYYFQRFSIEMIQSRALILLTHFYLMSEQQHIFTSAT